MSLVTLLVATLGSALSVGSLLVRSASFGITPPRDARGAFLRKLLGAVFPMICSHEPLRWQSTSKPFVP
jgi:hypothetical protein